MSKEVLKLLKFTNNPKEEELIIEHCGDYFSDLATYKVVLPINNYQDMCFFIKSTYSQLYQDKVNQAFDINADKSTTVQMCKIHLGENDSYTQMFIENAGGIDRLIGHAPSSTFDDNDFLNDEEEEDPVVIEELREQVKSLEEDKNKLEESVSKLQNRLDKLRGLDEYIDTLEDLTAEDIDTVVDIVEELPPTEMRNMLLDILGSHAGDENSAIEDLVLLKVYLNNISDWLMSLDLEKAQ